MSEWEAFVCCTCYRDGRATEPPCSHDELMVNHHGIVTLKRSKNPGQDPDDLWNWRVGDRGDLTGRACVHPWMHVVDEIFYWPGSFSHPASYPTVERLVGGPDYPNLNEAIHSPPQYEYASGGIWLTAAQAAETLAELTSLRAKSSRDLDIADVHFLEVLARLLIASTGTGNPIINHYNGVGDDSGW